jgi:Cu/Ag efflux pump CusA
VGDKPRSEILIAAASEVGLALFFSLLIISLVYTHLCVLLVSVSIITMAASTIAPIAIAIASRQRPMARYERWS